MTEPLVEALSSLRCAGLGGCARITYFASTVNTDPINQPHFALVQAWARCSCPTRAPSTMCCASCWLRCRCAGGFGAWLAARLVEHARLPCRSGATLSACLETTVF